MLSYSLSLTQGTDTYTVPSSSIVVDSVQYTRQYLNGLKSGSQTVKIQIRGNDTTSVDWILSRHNISCTLTSSGITGSYDYNFAGYVAETITWGFSTEGYTVLQLTLEDARSRLDKIYNSTGDKYFSGTLTELIADICDKCNLTVGTDISGSGTTAVAKLISKETTCRDILDEVCLECCAYYVIDGYTLNLKSIQAAPSTASTISQSNIYDKGGTAVSLNRTVQQYTCSRVEYSTYSTLTGVEVFNDDSLSESNPHTLAANHYYPGDKEITGADPGTPSTMEVSYRQTGKDLVTFTNLTPTFITVPACTCSMTKASDNTASLLIKNTSNVGALISKISATADVTFKDATNWVDAGTVTTKKYETEAEWIHDLTAAQRYANLIQQYYEYSDYTYTFYTKTPLEIGKVYDFDETLYSGIDTKVLITKVEYTSKLQDNAPLYKVTATGWDTFDMSRAVTSSSETIAPRGGTGRDGRDGRDGMGAWSAVCSAGITQNVSSFTKTSHTEAWDEQVYSRESFSEGCYVSCQPTAYQESEVTSNDEESAAIKIVYNVTIGGGSLVDYNSYLKGFTPRTGSLEYAVKDGTNPLVWQPYPTENIVLVSSNPNPNVTVYIRGTGVRGLTTASSLSRGYWPFDIGPKTSTYGIHASGITSVTEYSISGPLGAILNYQDPNNAPMEDYAFRSCFGYDSFFTDDKLSLINLTFPNTISLCCYQWMFCKDTFNYTRSLVPIVVNPLPSTTVASYCYQGMFAGNARLRSFISVLPATTLAYQCYTSMFRNSNLTELPDLPATNLPDYCYGHMFYECTSLKIQASRSYDCQKAYRIPSAGTGTVGSYSLNNMFYNTTGGLDTPEINTTYYTYTSTAIRGSAAIGLSHNPSAGAGYDSIDACILFHSGSQEIQIYESGVYKGAFGAYTDSTQVRIGYEQQKFKYYKDGVLIYTSDATPVTPLYLDSSFYSYNSGIKNVVFGAMGAGTQGDPGPSTIKQYALSTSSINPPPVDEHGVFTTPITPEAAWKHGTYIWSQIVYDTTPATVSDTHYEQTLTETYETTKLLSVTVSPFVYTKNMRARGTSDKTEIELTFINIDYYDYDTLTVTPSCGTYDPTTRYVTIPYATADEVCNIGIVLTKSGTQVGTTSTSLEATIVPQQWLNLGSFTTTPVDSDGKIIGGPYVDQYAMEGDVYLDVSGTIPVARILDRNLQPARLVDSTGTSNYDDKLLSLFPAAFGDNTTNHAQIEGYDCFENVITDHITANYIGSKEIQVLDKIYAGTINADNPWGERVTSANGFLLDKTGNMEARNCYLRDVRASNMTLGADCNISGTLDNDVIKTNIKESSDTTTYTSSSANKNVDAFLWSDGNVSLQAWATSHMNPGTASYLTGSYADKTWYSAVNYTSSVPTTVSLYSNSSWAPESSTTTKYSSVAVCARRIRVRGQQYACANAFYNWMTPYVKIVIGGTEHTIVSHNSGSDWASQGVNIPSKKQSFDATYTVPAGQSFSIVVEGRDYTLNSWNGSLYIDEKPAEIYNIGLTLFQQGATTGYRVDDLVGSDNYCRATPNLKIDSYTVFTMDFTRPATFPAEIHPLYLFEWTSTAPTPGSWSFFESSSLSLTNENGVEVTANDWTSASWDAIHISVTSSDSTATLSNTSFVRSFSVSFRMKSQVKAVYTKHIIPKAPDETWDLPGTDTWDIGASETLRYRNGFFKNVNTERLTIGGITYTLSVSGSSLVLTPVTD